MLYSGAIASVLVLGILVHLNAYPARWLGEMNQRFFLASAASSAFAGIAFAFVLVEAAGKGQASSVSEFKLVALLVIVTSLSAGTALLFRLARLAKSHSSQGDRQK